MDKAEEPEFTETQREMGWFWWALWPWAVWFCNDTL